MRLTKKKKAILELCKTPISINSLLKELNVDGDANKKDKLRSLRRTLESLILDKLIEKEKSSGVIVRNRKRGAVENNCDIFYYKTL